MRSPKIFIPAFVTVNRVVYYGLLARSPKPKRATGLIIKYLKVCESFWKALKLLESKRNSPVLVLSLLLLLNRIGWTIHTQLSLLAHNNLFSSEARLIWESLLNNTNQESALVTISFKRCFVAFQGSSLEYNANDVLHWNKLLDNTNYGMKECFGVFNSCNTMFTCHCWYNVHNNTSINVKPSTGGNPGHMWAFVLYCLSHPQEFD